MDKIKSLRASLGMSQEELAEMTGLSLRTIQRIENGGTRPRGDSLKRISKALGAPMEALWEGKVDAASNVLEASPGLLILLNLSALVFLLPVPGLGIAVPLVLWLLYRGKVAGMEMMGRRMVNFQLTWLLVKGVIYGAALLLELNHVLIPGFTYVHFWLVLRVLDAFNINCVIVNAIRVGKHLNTNYAPAIPFLRGSVLL